MLKRIELFSFCIYWAWIQVWLLFFFCHLVSLTWFGSTFLRFVLLQLVMFISPILSEYSIIRFEYEYNSCIAYLNNFYPFCSLFDDNLREVDKGIGKIFALFNGLFTDGKTAYIFTSDHGMSNKGGHGAGTSHETETPIVAWGAGITNWRNMIHSQTK